MSSKENERVFRAIEKDTESIVLELGRHGYHDARKVFNSSVDKHPSAVVKIRRSGDIERAVRLLSDNDLAFTIRSGGHSIAGTCVADDVVMLDLSLLRRVEHDEELGVTAAEPGALWCDYDAVTTRHGLASTGGIVSHTGVAGLTLGGGLGWLMGEGGLACDSLVGVDAIDARGELCRVREGDSALRLFRGGGRSLAVVTRLYFRPWAIPSRVSAGRLQVDLSGAPDLFDNCSLATRESPDWLTVSPSLIWSDDGWNAVLDFVSTRGAAETSSVVADAYGSTPNRIAEMPYTEAQRQLDTELRFGRRNYWKSLAVRDVAPSLVEALAAHLLRSPSPQTFLSVDVLHGRSLTEPQGGSSYLLRDRPLVVLFNTIWEDAGSDRQNIDWCLEGFEMLAAASRESSTYSNYFSADDVGTQPGSEEQIDESDIAHWRVPGLL